MSKYFDYNNIFLVQNAAKFPKYIEINDYTIKLEENKQLSLGPIYSLGLIEMETLKIYIKINLANNFIWPSKSLTRAFILFD